MSIPSQSALDSRLRGLVAAGLITEAAVPAILAGIEQVDADRSQTYCAPASSYQAVTGRGPLPRGGVFPGQLVTMKGLMGQGYVGRVTADQTVCDGTVRYQVTWADGSVEEHHPSALLPFDAGKDVWTPLQKPLLVTPRGVDGTLGTAEAHNDRGVYRVTWSDGSLTECLDCELERFRLGGGTAPQPPGPHSIDEITRLATDFALGNSGKLGEIASAARAGLADPDSGYNLILRGLDLLRPGMGDFLRGLVTLLATPEDEEPADPVGDFLRQQRAQSGGSFTPSGPTGSYLEDSFLPNAGPVPGKVEVAMPGVEVAPPRPQDAHLHTAEASLAGKPARPRKPKAPKPPTTSSETTP